MTKEKINSVKLFPNNNDKSKQVAELLEHELEKNNFNISDKDYQLAIAVSGAGSFLRMVKNTQFNSNIYYIGVNTGTLGLLQEIKPNNIKEFARILTENQYRIEEVGIQETKIESNLDTTRFYSLNEIVLRDKDLNTTRLNILVDDIFLEKYVGDGILICTSVDSTAYNKSYGGSILYSSLHTLQITPIAPLDNNSYRSLTNSIVIPETSIITVLPENKNLIVSIDGENRIYDNVSKVETSIAKKRIKCLRTPNYNFTNIVQDKLLK